VLSTTLIGSGWFGDRRWSRTTHTSTTRKNGATMLFDSAGPRGGRTVVTASARPRALGHHDRAAKVRHDRRDGRKRKPCHGGPGGRQREYSRRGGFSIHYRGGVSRGTTACGRSMARRAICSSPPRRQAQIFEIRYARQPARSPRSSPARARGRIGGHRPSPVLPQLAQAYAAFRSLTIARHASLPQFHDAVTPHWMLNAIETAGDNRQRSNLRLIGEVLGRTIRTHRGTVGEYVMATWFL